MNHPFRPHNIEIKHESPKLLLFSSLLPYSRTDDKKGKNLHGVKTVSPHCYLEDNQAIAYHVSTHYVNPTCNNLVNLPSLLLNLRSHTPLATFIFVSNSLKNPLKNPPIFSSKFHEFVCVFQEFFIKNSSILVSYSYSRSLTS